MSNILSATQVREAKKRLDPIGLLLLVLIGSILMAGCSGLSPSRETSQTSRSRDSSSENPPAEYPSTAPF